MVITVERKVAAVLELNVNLKDLSPFSLLVIQVLVITKTKKDVILVVAGMFVKRECVLLEQKLVTTASLFKPVLLMDQAGQNNPVVIFVLTEPVPSQPQPQPQSPNLIVYTGDKTRRVS